MQQDSPVSQIFELFASVWNGIIVPFFSMLWDLATTDPPSALSVLVIVYVLIWAYQSSVNLGR